MYKWVEDATYFVILYYTPLLKGATGETFLHLYSIEKSIEAFGKSYTSFTPNGDGTIAMAVHI